MGGWPSCLSVPGTTHRIKFGYVPVTLPDGSGFRQIVWVTAGPDRHPGPIVCS